MADYYNKSRGPLSLTLNDGSSCVVSPKSWIFIAANNENSASIAALRSKGFLVKAAVARTAEAPVSEVEVAAEVPKAAEAVAVPAPVPSAPVATSSMKEEINRKKR